ncbi:LysR family transcriptional regulator [Lacimicrobium alkaliphilum]|uniref:LysR family transcriptional regulator n=1 Tax=Lacimicrobium alkaliphilum TaxID=1526571 RepID=A0ABQ1R6J0_9ALTE|nr:LysR family transcriptional regulator [Lacimicrobium alkaliphilum]GGD60128.1 LysR family transcriptional regulator [Lacimicrobium alkaliphilum]
MNSIHSKTTHSSSPFQQLDLNLLKIFEALYQERNMSRAAQRLHLTPSAVSHAIKRLRTHLADPLFTRQGNVMQPTALCESLAPALINNLGQLREILQLSEQFSPQTAVNYFRIGIHEALEKLLLPPLAAALAAQAPGTSLASYALERSQMARQLAGGTVDIAIDVSLPISEPVLHRPLLSDRFCVVMAQEHSLYAKLNKKAYAQARHISVSHRASGPAIEDIALRQQGVNRRIALHCQSYGSAINVVRQSDLLLTMPAKLAGALNQDGIVICNAPVTIADIAIHQYWHKNTDNHPALSWLRQLTHAVALAL